MEPKKPEINLVLLIGILAATALSQIWQGITWPIRLIRRQF